MKKIDVEKEEKLSMTRELKFKELQDQIDEEEADKIVEEAIKKSKKKIKKEELTTELEQEIDELLEVETKKRGRQRKKVELENVEEELSELLDQDKKVEVKSQDEVKITKVNVEEDLYLTSSFKPLKHRIKAGKVFKFLFKLLFTLGVLGAFVYFVLLPLYKMLEDSKPKAIFDHSLDYVQEQIYTFLDTNVPIDTENFTLETILYVDSNIKDMDAYVDNEFVFTVGYKEKDGLFENGYYVQNKNNVRHGVTYLEKDGVAYTKLTTNDSFLKHGFVEEEEELEDTKVISTEDYKYYVSKIVTVLKESIKEDDLVASKEELMIDGFSTQVVRNSLELNKTKLLNIEKEINNKLLKDEKFLKIEAAINDCSLKEVKESYKETSTYEDDYVLSINIYTTKGTKFVGFDIEENGFRNYYFYKYDNKFEAHVNLTDDEECNTGGDCVADARMVIDLVGTTKNNETVVDVLLNSDDIGSLVVTEFNYNTIDFDYNIIIGDIRYQGDVFYEFNKDKKTYDFSFSLEFNDEYVRLSLGIAFDTLVNVGYVDEDNVLDYTDKLSTDEYIDLYKELDKLGMTDSFDIYMDVLDMVDTLTTEEEKESITA